MHSKVIDRVVQIIENISRSNDISSADIDELRILHSRTRSSFPNEFNELMESLPYGATATSKKHWAERLIRILKVVASLPDELKQTEFSQEPESTELIPLFELGKSDKVRIFELCTGMRKIIFATQEFDQPHRKRLLDRVAAIEAETHKPKGMFDVVRAGVSDLGETLGKFGKDIKPLTDRMAEVVRITRKGTKEYDQLPPPEEVKRLPAPTEDEES